MPAMYGTQPPRAGGCKAWRAARAHVLVTLATNAAHGCCHLALQEPQRMRASSRAGEGTCTCGCGARAAMHEAAQCSARACMLPSRLRGGFLTWRRGWRLATFFRCVRFCLRACGAVLTTLAPFLYPALLELEGGFGERHRFVRNYSGARALSESLEAAYLPTHTSRPPITFEFQGPPSHPHAPTAKTMQYTSKSCNTASATQGSRARHRAAQRSTHQYRARWSSALQMRSPRACGLSSVYPAHCHL